MVLQGNLVHEEPAISKRSVSVSYLSRNSVRTLGVRFLPVKKREAAGKTTLGRAACG